MAVRMKQRLEPIQASKVFGEQLVSDSDTGIARMERVDYCASLPPVRMTNLKTMLKAGVPMEQVNCKLIDPVGTVKLPEVKVETKNDSVKED